MLKFSELKVKVTASASLFVDFPYINHIHLTLFHSIFFRWSFTPHLQWLYAPHFENHCFNLTLTDSASPDLGWFLILVWRHVSVCPSLFLIWSIGVAMSSTNHRHLFGDGSCCRKTCLQLPALHKHTPLC